MQTIHGVSSEEKRTAPIPASSRCLQEDDAFTRLLEKDPVLGQVMNIILGKLDETNKKLDETNKKLDEANEKLDTFHNELRTDLDTCQDQVNKLQDANGMMEKDQATPVQIIPAVNAEDLEKKGRQSIEDCLVLPTILRRILEQFSDKELINLSLVNKLWNYEARSVLRDRGRLKAKICSSPLCLTLVHFASDLKQMRVVPFSGIHLDIYHCCDYACPAFPIGTLDSLYQVILDRLPWRHLSLVFYDNWLKCSACPALVLFKRILEDYSGVLEQFSIDTLDNDKIEFIQRIVQDRSFPSLKIMKIQEDTMVAPLPGFIKALVSCAPNLEKFYLKCEIEFNENVMEGSSAVLVATDGLRPGRTGQICESLIPALRTRTIHVFWTYDGSFEVEVLSSNVPMLIQASHSTLETVRMDLLFAVPLMSYGICLENVTTLDILMNHSTVRDTQANILTLVKGLDLTRLFPKLNRVRILDWQDSSLSSEHISGFVDRGNKVARKALPDRPINITHLELGHMENASSSLVFLAEMFPHVRTVSVQMSSGKQFLFTTLWEHFDSLVELTVSFSIFNSPVTENWDSVFCGIFPEEVAELREKDDEYLKAVNVVPVMPSINCMRGLRCFTLCHHPGLFCNRIDPTRIFSKVTGLISFLRCPALSVELAGSPYDHKTPYIPAVIEDEDFDFE